MKLCFNIFQNERKYLGDLPQRLQQMAEISADSLSELESYGQGKQYIHFFALMHAWFPFGHLLYYTQCLFVKQLVAGAACNFNFIYLTVFLYDKNDVGLAFNARIAALFG